MTVGARALKLFTFVERGVVIVLLGLLILVVMWATWGLANELVTRLFLRVASGVDVDREWSAAMLGQFNILRDVFGSFLLILIGLELMKTVVMYLDDHVLHVEVVITVAIIGIARHAVELDIGHVDPMTLVGMGAMILALSVGYYLFQRAAALTKAPPGEPPPVD